MMPNLLYLLTMFLAAALMGYNAIFLFLKGGGNRARSVLGYTNVVWCVMFSVFVVLDLLNIKITNYPMLSHKTLLLSNFMVCIMFFFPLEVVMPGWLTRQRTLLLFTPAAVITALYFLILWLLGEDIEELFFMSDIWASLSHFNVWFRFVLLFCNLGYCFVLLRFIYQKEQSYQQWKENYYSDREDMDISWMNCYFYMIVLFVGLYLVVAIWGHQWSVILDTLVSVVAFSVVFYKGLFHENPYPEDFYQPRNDQEAGLAEETASIVPGMETALQEGTEVSFDKKIPHYIMVLKEWMDNEKPYLYKDFKLTDANRVLPLNRTYLSRLFNEGFHQTFSEVVREYRINYAKKLLSHHPEMPIYEVAKAVGFSSDSSFIKAFQKVTGTTPRNFRFHGEV